MRKKDSYPQPQHYQGKVRKGKRRIAVYCRVSTLNEEQDMSFETQCSYYQKRVDADRKLTLVGIYADHGISGLSTNNRVEFMRLMDDCLNGKVDEVWTKSISRFARNLGDCVRCVRQLKEKGIPVVFEKEGINSMDANSEMLLSVLAACAQEESNNLSQNIRWANEHRAALGMPSTRAAYGYRRDKYSKTNAWVIHEDEARRVRLMFQMAADGHTFAEIADALTRMDEEEAHEEAEMHEEAEAYEGAEANEVAETHGEETEAHEDEPEADRPVQTPRRVPWKRVRIAAYIKNVVYIGDFLSHKTYTVDCFDKKPKVNRGQRHQYYIDGHHEPLVDKDTFALANRMLKEGALSSSISPEYHERLVQYVLCPTGERPRSAYARGKGGGRKDETTGKETRQRKGQATGKETKQSKGQPTSKETKRRKEQ